MHGSPPPGGFGAPGGQGPAPDYVAPAPRPSWWTVRRVTNAFVLALGLPCLLLVIAAGISVSLDKKRDLVVFDNRLDVPAEIVIDGKVVETVKAHSTFWIHPVVKLPEGAKKIEVRAAGKVVSEAPLFIRARRDDEQGYRGLYVIGDAREYVIAKMPYFADDGPHSETASIAPIPTPAPITELPRELTSSEISSIDGPFTTSESMPKGAKVYWKTQLCTVDRASDPPAVGCSGFFRR